jgi:ATP-binding protein involved in chromosome partitioning
MRELIEIPFRRLARAREADVLADERVRLRRAAAELRRSAAQVDRLRGADELDRRHAQRERRQLELRAADAGAGPSAAVRSSSWRSASATAPATSSAVRKLVGGSSGASRLRALKHAASAAARHCAGVRRSWWPAPQPVRTSTRATASERTFARMADMPSRDEILKALEAVIDPELRSSIVELGMVRSIDVHDDGRVAVMVSLTTPGCPIRNHFQTAVAKAVSALEGVTQVDVSFDVLTDQEKGALQQRLGRSNGLPAGALAMVSNIVCVGSGKGGVGKSTVTANLAAALAEDGKKVGILDADVWGYSIPRMYALGATRPKVNESRKIVPLEGPGGVKVMSIGFFVQEDSAVVWRGPMLHKALTQFLEDVDWGELDFLLIDLPPGTGDVAMTLAQLLPQAQFLIVTTPQPTAQKVARRAAEMAHKVNLDIAGVVENMSGFTTPSGERFQIFGEGGGQELADELDVPLLGKVPLTMPLREQADAGLPLVFTNPDDPAAQGIRYAARGLVALFPAELPMLQMVPSAPPAEEAPAPTGFQLPVVQG